jgi:hypothetical protein
MEPLSTPLINLSQLPSYTFSAGPGVYEIQVTIADSKAASTTVKTNNMTFSLTKAREAYMKNDPASFLDNITARYINNSLAAAAVGDLSYVAASSAIIDSTIAKVRGLVKANSSEILNARTQQAMILETLRANMVPTIDISTTLVSAL